MTKLAELEQTLSERPGIYQKKVQYFPGHEHEFHSVHLIVAPYSLALDNSILFNEFMASLLRNHPDGRDHLSYATRQGTFRLGHTEFNEELPGALSEVTTKSHIILDPELAEQAKAAGALEENTVKKVTPLARRIHVRPYPTVSMAGFVAAYEGGIIEGTVQYNSALSGLRKEITLAELAEVIQGKNPFPRIIRVPEGYYQGTPAHRAMIVDFRNAVDTMTDLAKVFGTA